MNIYDTANKLAAELKQTDEYKAYKNSKQQIESNAEVKSKIDGFVVLNFYMLYIHLFVLTLLLICLLYHKYSFSSLLVLSICMSFLEA